MEPATVVASPQSPVTPTDDWGPGRPVAPTRRRGYAGGMTYRQMPDVLGEGERDGEAVRVLGQWRDRVRTRVLLAFAVAGLAFGAGAWWATVELQMGREGFWSPKLCMMISAIAWTAAFAIGNLVSRAVVRRGMSAKVTALARAYEIPRDRLDATATLVAAL